MLGEIYCVDCPSLDEAFDWNNSWDDFDATGACPSCEATGSDITACLNTTAYNIKHAKHQRGFEKVCITYYERTKTDDVIETLVDRDSGSLFMNQTRKKRILGRQNPNPLAMEESEDICHENLCNIKSDAR